MNRAVECKLHNLTANEAGEALLLLMEIKTEGFEKYKEHYSNRDDIPDPTPLFKYAIRLFYNFSTDNRKATLFELKEPKGPYRTVTFGWFNGRFEYDSNRDTYMPVKITGVEVKPCENCGPPQNRSV